MADAADQVFDLVVIGWGKAGKTLARKLGSAGWSVAMVEESADRYGGTCINVACVPTKALAHSAANRDERPAQQWFATAMQRRDELVGALRDTNEKMLTDLDSVSVINGHARFVGPRLLEVDTGAGKVTIEGRHVVVNTGTAPARLDLPGADGPRVHDSETVQTLTELPGRLVIIGGGHVGLEFASIFAGFGSQVTLLNRGETILRDEDPDVAEAIAAGLAAAGVTFVHDASATEIRDDGQQAVVVAGEQEYPADAVLMAVGRRPRSAGLGLAAAGIDTDARGFIVVDEKLRTSAPNVWAVGDINGGPQFTYISLDDHRIVADQLTGPGRRSTAERVAVPRALFVNPTFARVGLTQQEAAAQRPVKVASKPVARIAAMPRPKIEGDPAGLIKFVVDERTDEILGAALYCLHAEDFVNLVALAMRTHTTATQLFNSIWTHPSITEAVNEVLGELHSPVSP